MSTSDRFVFQQPLWQAAYHEPSHPRYEQNPLILALPVPYAPEQAVRHLRVQPSSAEAWRHRPAMARLEALLAAADFFQPLTQHLELEQRFSRLLRHGYVGRNPLEQGYWADTQRRCQAMTAFVPGAGQQAARVQGFTLLGISGIGKSRALERVLSLYPQVIVHDTFAGRRFTWIQLVWLKLDCPQDGSLKGLCQAFFEEVDAILGTHYYAAYAAHGKASTDQMLVFMARVARLHSLGALVIDEVQHLRQAAGNMAERVLNFFVQLDNTIGVPVILVGTPKALDLLAGEFRRARRAVGQGDLIWNRMPEDDADWRLLIDTLWGYQFVREPCPLTPAFRHLLYEESQGITDLAIKVYFLAQMTALFQGQERLTVQRLQQTARRDLQLVQPFLAALRTNNQRAIIQYEDIRSINLRVAAAAQTASDPPALSEDLVLVTTPPVPLSAEDQAAPTHEHEARKSQANQQRTATAVGYASFIEYGWTRRATADGLDAPTTPSAGT